MLESRLLCQGVTVIMLESNANDVREEGYLLQKVGGGLESNGVTVVLH
jgi:hypothetical protein